MSIRAKDVLLLGVAIAAAPAVSLLFHPPATPSAQDEPPALSASLGERQDSPLSAEPTYTIYDRATGRAFECGESDYLVAALLSELPVGTEPEAMKAQAVATRTYARYVKARRQQTGEGDADFSVDTSTHLGFMTEERAAAFYGTDYSGQLAAVTAAVDGTRGIVLLYDGDLIAACYHAISPGRTENSENVFSEPLPYLVAVDSSLDESAEGYSSEVVVSADDLRSVLTRLDPELEMSGSPAGWLGASAVTPSGTVTQLVVCGRAFSGQQIREAFALRSAAFTASYTEGEFKFSVKGYGHGVGMSQNGANELAKQGLGFVEILERYYTGAVCVNADES